MILSTMHKNEHENIYSKINNACSNLTKHSPESIDGKNSLFIKVPTSISLSACSKWIADYFHNYFDKPISYVFIYQTTVAYDLANGKEMIHHSLKAIENTNRSPQNKAVNFGEPISFNPAVGLTFNESSTPGLTINKPDGGTEFVPLELTHMAGFH